MAKDPNPKPSPFNVPDEDEEALLNDLNLNESLDADALTFQEGAPLPKKVELDIDDMPLDDEEEVEEEIPSALVPAGPSPAPRAPEPKPAPPKPEKRKLSRIKLLILLLVVLIPLLGIGGTLGYLWLRQPPPPPRELEPPPPPTVDLKPFLVNFPGPKGDLVFQTVITLTFPDEPAAQEFRDQLLVMRDLIFRFLLAQPSPTLGEAKATEDLAPQLDRLINARLRHGGVKSLKILYIKEM